MADETHTGYIHSVAERQLYRKSDNQPFTMYDIETSQGRMGTTKKELADEARTLIGTPVIMAYTEKENNGFVNRYLNRLNVSANLISDAQQHAPAPPEPPLHATDVVNQPIGRDEAIWRQTATKVAAGFNNKDLAEYWDRVKMLIDFYRSGEFPGIVAPENQFIPPAGSDAILPGPLDVSDDDIPF